MRIAAARALLAISSITGGESESLVQGMMTAPLLRGAVQLLADEEGCNVAARLLLQVFSRQLPSDKPLARSSSGSGGGGPEQPTTPTGGAKATGLTSRLRRSLSNSFKAALATQEQVRLVAMVVAPLSVGRTGVSHVHISVAHFFRKCQRGKNLCVIPAC